MIQNVRFGESSVRGWAQVIAAIALATVPLVSSATNVLADEPLQAELGDADLDSIWLYDDWESAKSAAQRSGQPIFVVFR